MTTADNTSFDVVLIRGRYRLRYRIERCGQSEWIATVEDVTNARNLDTVRLASIDAARMTHATFSRAVAIAVGSGRWKTLRLDGGSVAQPGLSRAREA